MSHGIGRGIAAIAAAAFLLAACNSTAPATDSPSARGSASVAPPATSVAAPTERPTAAPTESPTAEPTASPTDAPTPTSAPTASPERESPGCGDLPTPNPTCHAHAPSSPA